ncbi:hypothetical protein LAZ67_14002656 [Cordylochernes scorpioides]|uniref:RNA-directed DNA polymerase n=1 Tax=Cordylochernes scorpioides TaxID=51811 RepID=A0ABY6L762_9ARAC|nr:hypothetical protein LAZ67_14002656 [Cordylochernes scorpioides]
MATSLVRTESPSKAEEKPARHGMQAQPCAELIAKQDLQKNFSISSSEDQRYANPPTGVGNANLAAARGDVTTGSAAATSSSAEDNCVYVEYIPELEPYHYIRAVDRMIGGTNNVFQVSKINGHYLMGLNNRSLAERLISEGLEVEGTLFRAFPFRKREMKITVGNLPFFVEDFTIISALTFYGRGHRRANCPLLAGRSNAPRPATPTSPTGVPPVTTPRPPQPPSAQPPPPASPSPAMEVSEVPSTSQAALHPPAAPRQSPPVAPAIPTEMAPPAPPPVTPAPSLRSPGSHGPAVPTLDVEMSIEETSTSSTSSSGTSTREGLVTFLERNPGVSFAQTDALGLGREEVLDLLSSKTKARKRGPLLSPSQGDALAGLIRQLLGLKPGGNSNIYKVLGQVRAALKTSPAAVPPTPPLPAPQPAGPIPPAPDEEEMTPIMREECMVIEIFKKLKHLTCLRPLYQSGIQPNDLKDAILFIDERESLMARLTPAMRGVLAEFLSAAIEPARGNHPDNFGHHVTQKDQLAENLKTRAQGKEETSDSYIQDVLHLCREVNLAMMENEIVAHLTKGISEEIYKSIIILDIATIDEFIKWCRKIEASNKKRVVFDRLPNVAAIDSADSESMEDLIRRIVREEVHRALNPEFHDVSTLPKHPYITRRHHNEERMNGGRMTTSQYVLIAAAQAMLSDIVENDDNGRRDPKDMHQAPKNLKWPIPTPSFEGEAAVVKNPPSSTAAKLQQNYVEIIIDDIAFSALVDSGSSFSVISDGLRRQLKKTMFKDSGMTLKVADGKNVTSIGRCTISLSINGLEQPLEFIVLPNSNPSIILGWDFLEASNAVIDCGRAEIRLEEAKDVLNSPASMGKVVASRSVVIPAESTKLINVMSEELNGQNQVLFEPSKKVLIGKGLTLPCALFRLSHNKGKLWIVNSSTTAQIVPKGMCLGKIQRVEENNLTAILFIYFISIYRCRLTAISECSEFNKEVKNANHASHADKSDFKFLQNLISDDLSEEQQSQILSILKRYDKIFDKNNEPVKQTSVIKHKIETENHQPIKHRPYRVSPTERQAIQTEVDKMLDAGIIRHSESPWSSPVILVKKKDGNWRFCVDYRRLNKVTKKDVYPLPRIDDTLDSLKGAKFYSSMDLRSGYWQIEVDEADREKTAFITPDGLYEFLVMPFGLCNAPATFERMMDKILKGLKWTMALCYLDDIVVYSKSFNEHLHRLEIILQCLDKAELRLNPKKCLFGTKRIRVFGHLVDSKGIYPDPEKIEAIAKFPTPKSITDVRSFIGLCSYYRRFIENFAEKAAPLHEVLKKDNKFTWNSDQQDAFDSLKKALMSEPVLAYFEEQLPTELHTDASGYGIGAVLVQINDGKERPVGYASRTLSKAEKNYSTTERECLAAIWAINKFRPYLFGREFVIVTNHHALCWLSNLKDPTGRLARWALKLQEYNVTVVYKSGRKHQDADCLSRNPLQLESEEAYNDEDDDIPSITALTCFEAEQRKDPKICKLIEETERFGAESKGYEMLKGTLYKKNFDPLGNQHLLVIPKHLRLELLKSLHDAPTAGHLGFSKTYERVKNKYFWPGLLRDIRKYVAHCKECQRKKQSTQKPPGLLKAIPPATSPFQRVGMDLLGRFPKSDTGNEWIIVCTDYLT